MYINLKGEAGISHQLMDSINMKELVEERQCKDMVGMDWPVIVNRRDMT